jgi:hypothetical protein
MVVGDGGGSGHLSGSVPHAHQYQGEYRRVDLSIPLAVCATHHVTAGRPPILVGTAPASLLFGAAPASNGLLGSC